MHANINQYEKQVYSQNGEDGIIEELLNRLGTTIQLSVEFGVEDGSECNTAYLAKAKDWSCILIEANAEKFQKLKENYASYPNVRVAHKFVTRENIVSIFEEMNIPIEFDLLSIDIDGNDYWVWQALSGYKPRIAIIEFNGAYPPPRQMVIKYNPNFAWDGTTYYGASLTSLTLLGNQMGYALLGTDSRGVNAFFVRRDLLEQSGFPELTPEAAYHPPGYPPHRPGEGPLES